jgi:sugar phosphate isomerase/epimerase
MRYVYFTKSLKELDTAGLIAFCKDAGLDGADLTVRPGYPVHPDNALTALPALVKAFRDEGLMVGLVTAPGDMTDASSKVARNVFEAAAKGGVPAIKIGYFSYQPARYDAGLAEARRRLAGFATLAARTGVRACYHTHSDNMYGNNAAGLRLLLQDSDPHYIGAFVDTGHTAINGGPFRMELDIVRAWLSLIAIKDMAWTHTKQGWRHDVVPAGAGIVHWNDVAQGLKDCHFNGTISLHGEYEAKELTERQRLAKEELAFLKTHLG